jgi:OOP family OmpA-OmpF porin
MRWTVTPFIGAGFSGDLESSPLNLGAALAYNWSSRIAFEGQFAYMNAEQGQLVEFDTNVWTLDANVLYHFAEERWIPYLALGLGMMRATTDVGDLPVVGDVDDESTELSLNFGGGVKRQLTDRVRLRGDLRYYNGGDLAPDFWRVTAGLTFALGRR